MRGFVRKLEWQNAFIEALNSKAGVSVELSGLTAAALRQWHLSTNATVPTKVWEIAVEASRLSESVNDFSAPTDMPIERAERELRTLLESLSEL